MNLMLKFAMVSCAGLTVLGTVGCKVTECTENLPDGGTVKKENCLQLQPTVEYRDARVRGGGEAWTSGQSVSIANQNGPLKVSLGGTGEYRVQFAGTPFTRETNDAAGAEKAKAHLGAMADPAFGSGEADINLAAPGGGVDGYDLAVFLPPEFDGVLKVVNGNGTTTLSGADGTKSTTVISHAIIASNLRQSVNLKSEVGDINVSGVPSGPGNVIRADLGAVTVRLGKTNLTIMATTDSGMVVFPMAWMSNLSGDKRSGSATLGDGSGALNVTSGGGNITFDTL